jgi:hypothetical protein
MRKNALLTINLVTLVSINLLVMGAAEMVGHDLKMSLVISLEIFLEEVAEVVAVRSLAKVLIFARI